ncbi:MAG: hypothetical protein R2726_20085 [Acidimicrobiales bacterium]
MPVAQTKASPRSIALVAFSVVLVVVLAGALFVFALPSLNESGKVEVKLGADTFDAGNKDLRAASIGTDGPILFSDVASGQRDIYLQHTGDAPDQGWLAFDARKAGQPRDCTLRWQAGDRVFADPCDGSIVPADGAGLVQYPVTVTDGGNVVIDLNAERRRAATTTAPTLPGRPPPRPRRSS